MAVIRAFRHEVKGHGTRHSTDVDCLYFDFVDTGGSRILQLSTLGSDYRQSQPKVSQTFQIGAEGAAELRRILEETFAGVGGSSRDGRNDPARAGSSAVPGAEPRDPIDRFIARAGLERVEELGVEGSAAQRRVLAHDDRPLLGGAWYIVDFTNVPVLRYSDVEGDLRTAPSGYQRSAVVVNDLSNDLEQVLVGAHADVVRLTDLGLPAAPASAEVAEAAVGGAQGQVPALQHLCRTLGVALADPDAAWPGFGKVVLLAGGGSAYVNQSNIDVRAAPPQVAQWARAGHGTVRGPQGQYLRMPYVSSTAPVAPAPVSHTVVESPQLIEAPPAPRPSSTFPWIEQLFRSERYLAQKALAGRASLSDDVVRDVVNALVRSGSIGPIEAIEREAGFPRAALRPMVPLLRRLLNVEGYDTLSFGDEMLILDDDLLRQQFGLSGPTLPEGVLL